MLVGLGLLLIKVIAFPAPCSASQKEKNSDRPKLPYNMMGIPQGEIDAYDSKAEPVAAATAALLAVNKAGWDLIHKYFPALGTETSEAKTSTRSDQSMHTRFAANYASEDAAFSPIPLLCMIWSLPESDLSGRLRALHNELAPAMALDSYFMWKLDDLRQAVNETTSSTKTVQGVKYRIPKPALSFQQALRLYAMTIALIRLETKWNGKTDSPPPDMTDFTNRLSHQMPVQLGDGETTSFFLYRPGALGHPLTKEEFEERADVVVVRRESATFEVEQFPVYLTANQKEWNPSWIEPKDEISDTTLPARKYEHDWTRLDGPFLWSCPDLLSGALVYGASVSFRGDAVRIEAERSIENRGMVKRIRRPYDYDPARMSAFLPGTDEVAAVSTLLEAEAPRLEDQVNGLKRFGPYFSNGFKAWCAYGLSTSGLAPDGKTWIAIPAEESRQSVSSAHP